MRRTRCPRHAFAVLTFSCLAAALTGCSTGESTSRVAVVAEAHPMPRGATLGAGDALGRGMQDLLMARIAAGETYATVTTPADPR